ncbi:MAG: ROK family protein [bacterium]|nr:ROK family protein [bacterium]
MYLLFDIGGTKFRYAVSRDGETIEEPVILSTPKSFEDAVKVFSKIQKELRGEPLKAVAVGIAGPLDEQRSMLVASPHIVSWVQKPLKKELERIFNVPAYLGNDSMFVGLGEAVHGAGQGYPIVAYLTVSTGVGGARIIEGKEDRSALGFEPGHQIVDFKSDVSCGPGCKGKGHLESFVSGTALERRTGKKAREVLDPTIWEELAQVLAVGLNNTVMHWSPDVVVLGGAMILGTPSIPWDSLNSYYQKAVTIFPKPPPLKKGMLRDIGGLHGALIFAKQKEDV